MQIQGIKRFIFLSFLTLPNLAWSQAFEALENIQKKAETYIYQSIKAELNKDQSIKVSAHKLDARLRLPACEESLEAYLPSNRKISSNVSVGIRCNSKKPWSIFVSVQVEKFGDVLVARHSLPRGQLVTANDFRLIKKNMNRIPMGHILDPKLVAGQVLKRNLTMDQVIALSMFKQPILIKRGQKVMLTASLSGIEVRMDGKALKDAIKGQRILVQATNSKRIIEGIATDSETVKVGL